jgi:hypothetical protein
MSQHDFNIANQTASALRSDLNSALSALASLSSGATAPSTTYANMLWYDTANNLIKMRNAADSGWISIGYLDQGAGAFRILDDTQVTNTSGTQTGLLGDQSTATWETGTGTTESLVSPAKVKAAIAANSSGLGVGQTWQNVLSSRASNVQYQNTTGKPIMVNATGGNVGTTTLAGYAGPSSASLLVAQARCDGYFPFISFTVPDQHYYKVYSGAGIVVWTELR